MEAARIAAERGYEVSLYEKDGMLGGLLNFAAAIKGPHQNLADYVAWSEGDLARKGVTVVCGQEVDGDFVREQEPDVVILATGGARTTLGLAATAGTQIVPITDVASAEIGEHVVIAGGNAQATDVAVWLLAQGKKVDIVMADDLELLSKGQSIWARKFTIPAMYSRGLRVWPEASIAEVGDGSVTVTKELGAPVTLTCDTLIEALDMEPNDAFAGDIATIDVLDVRVVGDASDPWNIQYAIRSGNWAARLI
jgi:pyruvate/2-oxoglutarate dehydrogenase complex dihydrolipoamide dehydrogenase (E3) component